MRSVSALASSGYSPLAAPNWTSHRQQDWEVPQLFANPCPDRLTDFINFQGTVNFFLVPGSDDLAVRYQILSPIFPSDLSVQKCRYAGHWPPSIEHEASGQLESYKRQPRAMPCHAMLCREISVRLWNPKNATPSGHWPSPVILRVARVAMDDSCLKNCARAGYSGPDHGFTPKLTPSTETEPGSLQMAPGLHL